MLGDCRSFSYPVASGLGDIFTNFLGGKTQRTDLGGKSGGGTDLTSGSTEVANINQSVYHLPRTAVEVVVEKTAIALSSKLEGQVGLRT